MTNTEIATLAKAGYVVVAADGQNPTNLRILGEIYQKVIPSITNEIVQKGEAMSMRKMVDNLVSFSIPHEDATLLFSILVYVFPLGNSNLLARELQDLLKNKRYSQFEMPELALRIKVESKPFSFF